MSNIGSPSVWSLRVDSNHRPAPYEGVALPLRHGAEGVDAPHGFEPWSPDSKSGVLPLDDGAEGWRKRQDSNLRDLLVCPVSTGVPSATRPRFRSGLVWEEWRAWQESNLQPSAPEADVLSIELRARVFGRWWVGVDSNHLSLKRQRFYRPPQLAVSVAHPKGLSWCARGDLNSHGLCGPPGPKPGASAIPPRARSRRRGWRGRRGSNPRPPA